MPLIRFGLFAVILAASISQTSAEDIKIEQPLRVETHSSSTTDDENELSTHMPIYEEMGFKALEWETWGPEGKDVLDNLLGPDFKDRTGQDVPEFASFDYLKANLTGGNFNDVIVTSRLPGDCGPDGCLVIVFRTDMGGRWTSVARFHALAVAHRYRAGETHVPELAAVGDDITPSTIFEWDGRTFVEK